MQPPAQEIVARDLHDNTWTFRHIYRGIAPFSNPFSSCLLIRLYSVRLKWCFVKLFLLLLTMSLLLKCYFNPILLFTTTSPGGLLSVYDYSRINIIHAFLFGVKCCFILCYLSSLNLTVGWIMRCIVLSICQKCTRSNSY